MNTSFNDLRSELLKKRRLVWEELQQKRFEAKGERPKNENWKSKYKEPIDPDLSEAKELPIGWIWASVSQLGFVVSGQTPSGITNIGRHGKIPWFKVGDMNTPGNETYLRDAQTYLSEHDVSELKLNIQPEGTIVFPKRGGAISTNKKRILAQSSAYDLNTMGVYPVGVEVKYFWYWFQGIDLGRLSDGSNVPQINHGDIEPLAVPVAPLDQQKRIVEEIEKQFSRLDEAISNLKHGLALADQLQQSVLTHAFSGKLEK